MSIQFLIEGGHPLQGRYRLQGNKNAALPIICASLLSRGRVTLGRVPRILDVQNLLEVVQNLGASLKWEESLKMDFSSLHKGELVNEKIQKLRGAILLLGALAAENETLHSSLPGGCPIGKRSFEVHWSVFRAAGFEVSQEVDSVRIQRKTPVSRPKVFLKESSVTATENALILFCSLGRGIIENPAREPHVFALIEFLERLGCEIETGPLAFTVHRGVRKVTEEVDFEIPGDYVDAGTLAVAAAVTGGELELVGLQDSGLLGVRTYLEDFGITLVAGKEGFWVSDEPVESPSQLTAGPWPLFPTDLVSLAIVLATQRDGLCLVHDWMYEARMFFVDKLIRMGARVTMCDPHRVLVEGPTPLRGTRLESPDIRAGMALLVAGLCARGTTTIEHAEVIKRGYEDIVPRLRSLGAEIQEKEGPG